MFKLFRLALLLALVPVFCFANYPNAMSAPAYPGAEFSCNLPAPTNLQAYNITPFGFNLMWNAVGGASGYSVVVTNTLTGAVAYSGTVSGTNVAITGLNSAVQYSVTVASICANGIVSALYANLNVVTEYIIVDDVVAQFPIPNIVTGCDEDVALPACLAVRYKNGPFESFEISNSDAGFRVEHDNQNPDNNGSYNAGWLFGNYMHEIPISNQSVLAKGEVSVFHFTGVGPFYVTDAPSQFSFQMYSVDPQTIQLCYNSKDYTIWKMYCTPGKSGNSSSSKLKADKHLLVSPVPFTDQMRIDLSSALIETESTVQLMDANGRLVRQIFIGAGTSQLNIETNELSPGIYWVRHAAANAVETVKVIKTE